MDLYSKETFEIFWYYGDTKSICSLTGKLEIKCESVDREKKKLFLFFSIEISISNKIGLTEKHKQLSEKKYLFVIE